MDGESLPDVLPHLLPTDATFKSYEGFITLQGLEEPFSVSSPSNSTETGIIKCSKALIEILKGHEDLVFERLAKSPDLPTFLVEFKDILERLYRAKQVNLLPPYSFYAKIVKELEAIGWDLLVDNNDTFTELQLMLKDSKNREHLIRLSLPSDYPLHAPECTVSLPAALDLIWSAASSTLLDVVAQCKYAFEQYQEFWDQLDDLDTKTWVLEPENPSRECTTRRIAVAKHCSILLEIDYKSPKSYPECRLMGADHVVRPLRESLHQSVSKWNNDLSLRENLQYTLGITLPSPTLSKIDQYSGECGICYAYRLESSIPDCVCENESCSRPYHRTCLVEWLRALPDTRKSFDTLFGTCPYCSEPITVRADR